MSTYLSCGNIMSDIIVQPSGEKSTRHMGGPAFFALSGIRLWEDDCALVTHTGADWSEDYEKWLDAHHLSKAGVRVDAEHVTCYQITYDENGRGVPDPQKSFSFYGDEAMGYLKTHPSDIKKNLTPGVKGLYMAQGADRVVWRQLAALKEEFHFKMMWELEYFNTGKDLDRVLEALPLADAWSLNHTEASGLFGIPIADDEKMLRRLQELSVPYTFYRVGKRGAFLVSKDGAWFCESIDIGPYVDQTGCGNSSTGAMMYALFSGHTPQEALVMANLASGYNCLQYGPYPLYTDEVRRQALGLRGEYLKKVKQVL